MFIDHFISYLVLIPSAVLCFFPMKDQLKHSRQITFLVSGSTLIALCLILGAIQSRFMMRDNAFLIPLLILCFLIYHFMLKVPVWKSLAVFCAAVALMSIVSNLNFCVLAYLHHFFQIERNMAYADLFQFGTSVVITAILAMPYAKKGSFIINQTEPPRIWNTTLLFSLSVFAVNMLLLPIEFEISRTRENIPYLLLAMAALLALWLLMQIIFYNIVNDMLTVAKTEERNRILEMQEMQFASQQRYMKATERVRHDFRHSLRTLTELYDAGDTDAVGRYLHEYTDSMPVNDITVFCTNHAVNALLNFYTHIASQNDIRFTLQVKLPQNLPVSDVDLCNMVGNILENAVIATRETDKRYIQLTILTEDDSQLYIIAVNSFSGKIRQKNGLYLSTNRKGNGIGLSSVISTAERYGGIAQFSHEGTRFYSNIAIPI